MSEVEEQFSLNYYRWAKRQFLEEIEKEFPLLSKFRCSLSSRVYEFLISLPATEQQTFAVARVKMGNPEASALCGEPMTGAEKEILDRYRNRNSIEYPVVGRVPNRGPSKTELSVADAIKRKELCPQSPTAAFQTAVLARVKATLGGRPEIDEFGTVKHSMEENHYKIATLITLKGRFPMRYTQYLTAHGGLSKETSFLKWMGIAGDTFWDLLTVDVADEAIEQLTLLCSRFISDASDLVPRIAAK